MKKLFTSILQMLCLFAFGFFGMGLAEKQILPRIEAMEIGKGDKAADGESDPVEDGEETNPANETKDTTSNVTKSTSKSSSPAKPSTNIVLLSSAKELSPANFAEYSALETPVLLFVGTMESFEQLSTMVAGLEDVVIQKELYWVNLDDTEFEITDFTVKLGEDYVMSKSDSLYFLRKKQVYYHLSLKRMTEESLSTFLTSIHAMNGNELSSE